MKIIDILTKEVKIKLRKPFKVAYTTRDYTRVAYVKILTDSGEFGLGEAVPNAHVTGDTMETIFPVFELLRNALLGTDPCDIEEVHKIMDKTIIANTPAKAAIDIACYDIIGKIKTMPVYKLLGGTKNSVITDMTIGIDTPEEMAKDAQYWVKERGFKILKVKCGICEKDDIKALQLIREAVGEDVVLRIDANQGYDSETFLRMLPMFEELYIKDIEQPLPYYEYDKIKKLKEYSSIPIMMDESVHSPMQAEYVFKHDMCDIVNIKLMKCGGIYNALKIADIAKKYGKKCMVGCMTETQLGAIAGASVCLSRDNFIEPDLDAHYTFSDWSNTVLGGLKVEEDRLCLGDKAGFALDEYDF